MDEPTDKIEEALRSTEHLRRMLAKGKSLQVGSLDERALIKSTAFAWFKSQSPVISTITTSSLEGINQGFTRLLESADRHTTRARYDEILKTIKSELVRLRSIIIQQPNLISHPADEPQPDFSVLIPDARMQDILTRRWEETQRCISCGAHLAATVMMGALLEALLLARVNRESDKSAIFGANSAPRDSKTGKTLPLKDWSLKHYIDVAQELGWIRQSAKDVSIVMRDYRNYVHPAKELSQGVTIESQDTEMFWLVFASLSKQIIDSAR